MLGNFKCKWIGRLFLIFNVSTMCDTKILGEGWKVMILIWRPNWQNKARDAENNFQQVFISHTCNSCYIYVSRYLQCYNRYSDMITQYDYLIPKFMNSLGTRNDKKILKN